MRKIAYLIAVSLIIGLIAVPLNLAANKTIKGKSLIRATETQTSSSVTNLGLYGGWPRDIAIDSTNPNNVYIITKSPNGLFWTNNGGSSWSSFAAGTNFGEGVAVALNPSNGDVYAAVGNTLLKSVDDGASWSTLSVTSVGQMFFRDNKLYIAGVEGKVYISSNGGSSFSSGTVIASGTGSLWDVAADSNGIIYAVSEDNNQTSGQLWRSADGGNTWTDMAISSKGVTSVPFKIAVNPSNNSHLVLISESGTNYQSQDGGSSWSAISASGVMAHFDATGRLYIGGYYADSPYSTFSSATTTTTGGNSISNFSIITNPSNSNIIYSSTTGGMAVSTDRGASWADINNGLVAVTTYDMSQATDKNIVWVATFNGLAKSNNFTSAAPTWEFPIKPGGQTGIDSVWVKPSDPNIVIASARGAIYKSTDGGSAWTQATAASLPSDQSVYQIVADPSNVNTLYGARANSTQTSAKIGGVLKSTDGGSTWTDMSLPDNAPADAITVARDGDIFVGVGNPSHTTISIRGVYKYSASSGSWSKLTGSPNFEVQAILADPENPNTIYAGAGDTNSSKANLYKSTDDGATWRNVTSEIGNIRSAGSLAIQTSTSPNSLYFGEGASGNGIIYKSSDGGETWGIFYRGLDSEELNALLFDGLVAGNNRGLYGLKSRASVGLKANAKTIKKGKVVKVVVSLKDTATKKKLKKRTVLIYKKVGKKWKLVKKVKLDKKATAAFKVKLGNTTVYQARWKPGNKVDKSEYSSAKSKSLKVKVK